MSVPANFNGIPATDFGDTALLLIDHQSGLFQGVAGMPMTALRANVIALAKAATLSGMPVIVAASVPQGLGGR